MPTKNINVSTKDTKMIAPENKQKALFTTIFSEIIYKNSGDSFGTIKITTKKFKSLEESVNFSQKYNFDLDLLPQNHFNLIDKFKNSKDKKELKFSDLEFRLLEKALHNSYSYLSASLELSYLKQQLAWANTAFDDKSNSYQKNLGEAGRRLGFTKGLKEPTANPLFDIQPTLHLPFDIPLKGKKRRLDPVEVTSYYNKLINSGIDRKDALVKCVKKYEIASNNACSAYLRSNGLKNIPQIRESTARLK